MADGHPCGQTYNPATATTVKGPEAQDGRMMMLEQFVQCKNGSSGNLGMKLAKLSHQ
jgi:hypothetical protein